jgi:hypothetical protein
MACANMNDCRTNMLKQLEHPVDEESLYSEKIYDEETANRRCYERNQLANILEGFGLTVPEITVENILRWAILLLVVYLLVTLAMRIFNPPKIVELNVNTPSELGTETIFKQLKE